MNLIELLDRPIAFHRPFVELGLGISGALFLSQSLYWSRRTNASGYFYKTQDEWESETGMSRREQETARRKLKSLGILEEKKQGVPCRVFYRINDEKLLALLDEKQQEKQSNPDCTKAPNQYGGMRQTRMAESDTLDCTNPPSSDGGSVQTKTETTQRLPETTNKKSTRTKIVPKSRLENSELPAQLNTVAWAQWLDYRAKVKKPFKTPRGERRAMNELIKLSQGDQTLQQRIVDQSIDFEWIGLFELKTQRSNGKPNAPLANQVGAADADYSRPEGF